MGIYSELIRKKDENNTVMEQYAKQALLQDTTLARMENEIDDMQSAVLYFLDRFHIPAHRQFGFRSVEAVLESMLEGRRHQPHPDRVSVVLPARFQTRPGHKKIHPLSEPGMLCSEPADGCI